MSVEWYCHSCASRFLEIPASSAQDVTCPSCGGSFVEIVRYTGEVLLPRTEYEEGEEEYEEEYEEGEEEGEEEYTQEEYVYDDEAAALDEIFFNYSYFATEHVDSGRDSAAKTAGGATEAMIDALSSATLTPEHVESEPECAICNEDFRAGELVCELGCKHHYHRHCIIDWLERQNSCPVCRWKLPEVERAASSSSSSSFSSSASVPPPPAAATAAAAAASAATATSSSSSTMAAAAVTAATRPLAGRLSAGLPSEPVPQSREQSPRNSATAGSSRAAVEEAARSSAHELRRGAGPAGEGASPSGRPGVLTRIWRGISSRRPGSGRASSSGGGGAAPGRGAGGVTAESGPLHQLMISPSQVVSRDGVKGFYALSQPAPPAAPAGSPSRRPGSGRLSFGSRSSGRRSSGDIVESGASPSRAAPRPPLLPGGPGTPSSLCEAQAGSGPAALEGAPGGASDAAAPSEPPLVWVSAASIVPVHLKATDALRRRVCVAYRASSTGGRVLYSRDVPKNQKATSATFHAHLGAAKRERQRQHPPQGRGQEAEGGQATTHGRAPPPAPRSAAPLSID